MGDQRAALRYTLQLAGICILFSVICMVGAAVFTSCNTATVAQTVAKVRAPRIILDAGHGGRDGGAIGVNGVAEKTLNLALTKAMQDVLAACGEEAILTRTTDALVCDENDPALKGKIKMTDLKNRYCIAAENPQAVFVSIHMNKFPEGKYSGLQGYYSTNHEDGFTLAKSIQDRVKEILQPENERKVKAAGKNIYLLDRITSPAVLIECGFLSNAQECERLCTAEYQTQLAMVLADCTLAILP